MHPESVITGSYSNTWVDKMKNEDADGVGNSQPKIFPMFQKTQVHKSRKRNIQMH